MKTLTSILIISLTTIQTTNARWKFTDENEIPQWASQSITKVKEENVMQGFGDGTFRPKEILNRAQAVTLLLRIKKINPTDITSKINFTDVQKDAWFAPAVAEATNQGWIKGYDDKTFRPANTLNKAEWATMITRAFDLDTSSTETEFRDIPSKAWFARPIAAIAKNNLIRNPGMNFYPEKEITRDEAAWIMAKILDMPRLLGTSKKNDFSKSRRTSSRRVAIKPRNFKANKQGLDVDKKELHFTTIPSENKEIQKTTNQWTDMGILQIENRLDDPTTLHSITLKLKFKHSSIGPAASFIIKLEGLAETLEKQISRQGSITFTGLTEFIQPEETKDIKVWLKPKENEYFYTKSGEGAISIFNADSSMVGNFKKESSTRQSALRFAPIGFGTRQLTTFTFNAK